MRILNVEPRRYDSVARSLLETAGEVDYVECETQSDFKMAIADGSYEAVVLRLGVALDSDTLAAGPGLRWAMTPTTGVDHIDLEETDRMGVTVISLRGETEFLESIRSTAEHTWALLLALVRKLPAAFADVQLGNWRRDPFLATELSGKTLGIIGYGRLGRMVANYGLAFRMRVLVHDIDEQALHKAPNGVETANLDQLLRSSDVVSIHLPLDRSTEGFLNRDRLGAMKMGAILVNTARGELIDEAALLERLELGHLAGAALDVLAGDSSWASGISLRSGPLAYARTHQNLVLTPHIGGYGEDSILKTRRFIVEKFLRTLRCQGAPHLAAANIAPRGGR
ncbi:MAG: hydroxyacid dehydrogenase [Acidobacteria bacterium]|nr:hydroxyacid dehydrogenase [Acidobacteriota bacterium]